MRFHHLSVSAFGPFPGTESVDFDDLNAGGLFLLTGPTGAGKTSILDAICFALYGSVPGERGVKTLKSHHAAADARPEVVLDFSIGGRRFVVRRSPEWSRPKRRGEGATVEKASATLVETTGGSEHFLSSRAQEVGHLVSGLIGMRASQFVQVAMLPQGEFARFLRAGSQDRHDVLQQLFKTDRFARIEEWVHDRSRSLRDRARAGRTEVQRVLDAVADRSGADLPDDLSGDALATADPDRARSWAAGQRARVEERQAQARAAHLEAETRLRDARAAHEHAVRTAEAVARRDAALAECGRVAPEAAAAAARAALEADTRAAACLPVLRMLQEARERAAATTEPRQRACDAVAALLAETPGPEPLLAADPDGQTLADLAVALRDRISRIEALLPRGQALVEARRARDEAASRLEGLQSEIGTCRTRLEQIPGEQTALREDLTALAGTAASAPVLERELAEARAALEAAAQVPGCEAEVLALQDHRREVRDRAADARERLQDLFARRLAGMAAELAGRLEAETPCPVCGSSEHPAPARPAGDAVTEQQQAEATEAYDRLGAELTEVAGEVVDAENRLEQLRRASGWLTPDDASARVAAVEQRLAAAERAAADHHAGQAALGDLEAELAGLTERVHELETSRAALLQAMQDHDRTVDAAERDLADALGGASTDPLDALLRRQRQALETVESAERAVRAHDEAQARVEELAARAGQDAAAAGFADPAAVQAAALDEAERTALEEMLHTRAEVLARVEATLSDPQVQAVADLPLPDLAAGQRALDDAEQAAATATRDLHEQEQACAALAHHLDRLEQALAAWEPVRAEHERTDSIARLVRGTATDNYLQMRLSAYVLATRLDQVLDAANERLGQMRDQRYLLERTGRAARKNARAGLGLQVLDSWTGEVRDPSTLSGGETFVVSLSLALGLADVVTQEAGGAEIDTLFVDEGFGTLDAETLDDVMDRLDGLRAGGRTVGVVSHVHELRTRIPTQLHVQKGRNGSTLAVRTLTA